MTERVWQLLLDSFSQILVPGLLVTIPLTILSFTFGLLIAIGTALVQIAQIPILKQVARFYIWVVRGTPLLVQLYVIFFGLPSLGIVLDAFPSAVLVFSVNTGAYAAETIRASIESVPKGQLEAGYSVGMSFAQTMRRIILPQAFRVAFPPLSNTLIGLVKDTSLAANITVLEMFMATQQIAARTYEPFALYCEVALVYLLFSTILTKLQAYGEKKLAVY
ncbi:amino acid ABC transporter permease [Streptococcus suis]|uniref:Amino acid ABC transporter permease n=9 Tax=Streptococcus suis TaxID=1307 RepID=A0A0K2E8T6_STRSU|nr:MULTISPECIES: amino acid ABC transporter permease [Streptococcus]AEB82322.1 polar amino acid ABC transporter, inner membrane subunit [Streptococcus suis ST3]AER18243.1 polar amino acid ABC transporter, inner membrane subunit [Streptococcus suis D9]AER20309.1 polar amino acid ABC transporter, inner membrane subunit [Streptococcus suis D12]AGL48799.1 ABC-type amino acid transport system, permease component [Streptococcus suis TL13]AGW88271.1 Amino acid ABC transporter, permease protein [Strep